MKKSCKILAWGLGTLTALTLIAGRLHLFRYLGNQEYKKISVKVNWLKNHSFQGSYQDVGYGLEKYYHEKGEFPASLEDLKPFVNKEALYDPFNIKPEFKQSDATTFVDIVKQPFQYERISPNEFYLWSYGPDEDNDKHQKEYNQKNGLKSDGDIILHVKEK